MNDVVNALILFVMAIVILGAIEVLLKNEKR